jgi:prepilin-type N-terminal cleavage/methylation domain-containing protein
MKRTPTPMKRPGFTLLEMILAASITVLLLAALYVAVDIQLRHASTARELVEQATLSRTLVNRIANDIEPSVNLGDPLRFQQAASQAAAASGTSGTNGATGGTGTPSTGGTTPTTGGATGTGGTGTGTTTGTGTGATTPTSTTTGPPVLLLQGTTDTLTIWLSRIPYNPNSSNNPNDPNSLSNPNAAAGFADTRRIDYWMAGGGGLGLARQEQTNITGDDALPGTMPPDVGDANSKLIIAPEVKSIQFQYFDGAEWQDSWDGTQPGGDGVTPLGPPAAVAVTIGLAPIDGGEMKMYRHVIAIPTANGSTSAQIASADGATTTVTTASSSNGNSASSTGSSDGSGQ